MPRGLRTAPLGTLEVPGDPYSLRVLQVGFTTPRPNGTFLADGSITLVWGGPVTALVDTGGPWGRQHLLDQLATAGVAPEAITHVICTHGHSDHVGNLNLFPLATLVLGLDISHPDGVYVPHLLAQGHPLVLHEGLLEVVATPGHTKAHVSLVVRGTRLGTAVVAGDLFEREGDDQEWGALSEDPAEQERSRCRVLAMADVIVPGHGPPFRVLRGATGRGTEVLVMRTWGLEMGRGVLTMGRGVLAREEGSLGDGEGSLGDGEGGSGDGERGPDCGEGATGVPATRRGVSVMERECLEMGSGGHGGEEGGPGHGVGTPGAAGDPE